MGKYDIEREKWDEHSVKYLHDEHILRIRSTYEETFSGRNVLKPVYHFFDLPRNRNATLLDIGCGFGWTAVLLAQKIRSVYAVDISPARIEVLKKRIEYNSITNVHPSVADVEQLPFSDERFDFVFGNAILHHLQLNPALSEIQRVLKKNGKAAFCEPFGHNPIVNAYRFIKDRYVTRIRGIHRPIRNSERAIFEKYFREVKFIETSFTSDKIPSLRFFESMILKNLLFLRRFASYITILLQK